MDARNAARYAEAVVEALRPHFADLSEPITAEVIQEAIQRNAVKPELLECLLDALGNWRLKQQRDIPERVRVACYRFNETDVDREREGRLNALLNEIH